ncbi:unnamed protein product [Periconia digitata]|uniref:Uncharacterized protein n=1 Tax=Periconia digitata TaxID=1303443 RepID=A0A9W4UFH4_9PLEO|nr:unnamed protein product [Periconia digitata]
MSASNSTCSAGTVILPFLITYFAMAVAYTALDRSSWLLPLLPLTVRHGCRVKEDACPKPGFTIQVTR